MSLFLARNLYQSMAFRTMGVEAEVISIPCVGSESYLQLQMELLDKISGYHQLYPRILPMKRKRIFAKPCKEHYQIWQKLKSQCQIEFDLLYAPRAWEMILDHWNHSSNIEKYDMWGSENDTHIIYIHSGGIEGNESQLQRYKYQGIID